MRPTTGFLTLAGFLCILAPPAVAEDSVLEKNLASYSPEAAQGYLRPLSDGFGQSLNTGFFTSASIPTEDRFGLRLEIQFGSVFFKDSDRTFEASTGGNFQPETSTKASTAVGDGTAQYVTGEGGTEYVFPGGVDLGSVSMIVPQLTVGTWKGTEAVVRWIAIDSGNTEVGDVNLLGFGVRHSISRYFRDPPVDVAASLFYQKFKAGSDDLFDADAYSVGAQVSRNMGWWEPFGSFTVDRFNMTATYDIIDDLTEETERVSVDIDNTNVHALVGIGIKASFVRFNVAGSLADRFGVSAGLSFGM